MGISGPFSWEVLEIKEWRYQLLW